jgi:AcrR family transcriptional regulator
VGLRATKQQSQRKLIIENAIALFREHGFDAVRVREIAESCTLSEATFFNYFGDKAGVLREWAKLELNAALAVAIVDAQGGPLRRVVRQWAAELARRAHQDPVLMRTAWLHVRLGDFAGPSSVARGRVAGPEPILPLIEDAQQAGSIRADLDAELLAQLLLSCVAGVLSSGLAEPRSDSGQPLEQSLEQSLEQPLEQRLRERLGRGADLLLDGFRKRNERVRPPAPGSRSSGPSPPASSRQ